MMNADNLAYTGPVLLGTPLQGSETSEFVYDTGSGFLTVNSSQCGSCTSRYYNRGLSSTRRDNGSGYTKSSLSYGSAELKGMMATDRVCLDKDFEETCVDNFGFFMVKS